MKTNILGTQNVLDACKKYNVKKLIFISSDKSVEPVNIYGMTKHIGEKIILNDEDQWSCVIRAGNIWGSRGSCIPYFIERKNQGKKIHLTEKDMRRYFIDGRKLAEFILNIIYYGFNKFIYVPKMKKIKIIDIVKKLGCDYEIVGKQEGEKLEEKLFWDSEKSVKIYDYYIIRRNR